jgi:hypothetical protein
MNIDSLLHIAELAGTIGIFLVGQHIKDRITKSATGQKVAVLEKKSDEHSAELKGIDSTLTKTNQTLASLDATVQGLAGWLKRVDERQWDRK